jgi:hypothetical protein
VGRFFPESISLSVNPAIDNARIIIYILLHTTSIARRHNTSKPLLLCRYISDVMYFSLLICSSRYEI